MLTSVVCTVDIKRSIYFPISPSVQTVVNLCYGTSHLDNSPSEGLAGIQVLHTLFLGSSSEGTGKKIAGPAESAWKQPVRRTGKKKDESKPLDI